MLHPIHPWYDGQTTNRALSRAFEGIRRSRICYLHKWKGGATVVIPYAKLLPDRFYSPIFVDGTPTRDKKAIIHALSTTTANTVILVGLRLCGEEDGSNVYSPMDGFPRQKIMLPTTGEGRAMLNGVKRTGRRYGHMLCSLHLAKQLPTELNTSQGELEIQEMWFIFYYTARGTSTPYPESGDLPKDRPAPLAKFDGARSI